MVLFTLGLRGLARYPSTMTGAPSSFSTLPLLQPLQRALEVLGFSTMTPVQAAALPALLQGRDVIAQARTGSGKTAAFGLGLLSTIDVGVARTGALVLCPTRELADQVSDELRRLARFIPNTRIVTLCGGVPARTQLPSLERAPHVVVGTPGRVLDHLARGSLDLRGLRVLVLDEADRLLDMGFKEAIDEIVGHAPRDRQTLLFSATFPDEIRALSRTLQRNVVTVTVADEARAPAIAQRFHEVEAADKPAALVAVLLHEQPTSTLVFCHTKNDVRDVTEYLRRRGFSTLPLHGDLDQRERDLTLARFAGGSVSVLVATDVAARGLDISGLDLVVSYELPTDPDVHVHRVGRTGRAGATGLAVSLCAPRERSRAEAVAAAAEQGIAFAPLPDPVDVTPTPPATASLLIEGGKQDKLRPGDLLGALTGDVGLPGDAIGKIAIGPRTTVVAIRQDVADRAYEGLRRGRIKGRAFRVWRLDDQTT